MIMRIIDTINEHVKETLYRTVVKIVSYLLSECRIPYGGMLLILTDGLFQRQ